MKKAEKLKGFKKLEKKEQKEVFGGLKPIPIGPCGETGGQVISWSQDRCWGYGIVWYNGECWACY
ncbi:hypothetical protein [Abyssalbus ytuae]|uniref:Uncharacterized protein n=1 Tax=Abyssalbus ytuae TaxID=2926907 RepID=A0A9E6ZN26_9FLAO|nr:hypothetical protein [Abyssalbus ytuae]UOB17719.1 hypothetical protein MQE35_00125 [Abyssalbus ytuae]